MDPETKFYLFQFSYIAFFAVLFIVGLIFLKNQRSWKTVLMALGGLIMVVAFSVISHSNFRFNEIQEAFNAKGDHFTTEDIDSYEVEMQKNRDFNTIVWRVENVGVSFYSVGFLTFCFATSGRIKRNKELEIYNRHLEDRVRELETQNTSHS